MEVITKLVLLVEFEIKSAAMLHIASFLVSLVCLFISCIDLTNVEL